MPHRTLFCTLAIAFFWAAPGFESSADAKSLFSFGKKKKEIPAPALAPTSKGKGDTTVYLTKFGPMTAAQYQARIAQEQARIREVVRKAEEGKAATAEARRKAAEAAERERLKADEIAARERAKAEADATRKSAAEQKRLDKIAAKEAEAAQKQAEAAQRQAEAAQKEADEQAKKLLAQQEAEKRRLLEAQREAQEAAEKEREKAARLASQQKPSTPKKEPAAPQPQLEQKVPAERDVTSEDKVAGIERITRGLAAMKWGRKSEPTEIASADSLGLTAGGDTAKAKADPAPTPEPAPTVATGSGSKIESLNRTIFDIVRRRKGDNAAASAQPVLLEGELYLTTRKRTPFYYFNPLQMVVPDLFLDQGTRVALVKRGKIWSDVRLEDGKEGVIANDFMEAAPSPVIDLSDDNAIATLRDFEYPPIPKDYVPPELPGAGEAGIPAVNPLLLPPLGSNTP